MLMTKKKKTKIFYNVQSVVGTDEITFINCRSIGFDICFLNKVNNFCGQQH